MSNTEKNEKLPNVNYGWYPGHMAKSKKQILEDLKLIDVILEIVDARIPISSQNPDIDGYARNKKRIIILNKADLADENKTKKWIQYYEEKNQKAIAIEANTGKGMKAITDEIKLQSKEITQKNIERGRTNYTIKVMVLGIPNVGKSTFINSLAGRSVASVENKPGVTRKNQWVQIDSGIELLDTPGMLWPKLENEEVATHLSFINSIGQNAVDTETIAYRLLKFLMEKYPKRIEERYNIELNNDGVMKEAIDVRDEIARKTGCLLSGGKINEQKVSDIILRDFRNGGFGRITIEEV